MVIDYNNRTVSYQMHRKRVLEATSVTDNHPPNLHSANFVKFRCLKEDANLYQRIMKNNAQLVINIFGIFQTTGRIQTFQRCLACELQRSNIPHYVSLVQKLEAKNFAYGRRLLCIKGELRTRRPLTEEEKRRRSCKDAFELPKVILSKYDNLPLPEDIHKLRSLLRPLIYFDLSIAGIWSLGRVIIQLYTEACPQVVLEFMKLCRANSYERLKFVHLYPNLWLEGELRLEDKTLSTPKIEYDMRALDHGQSAYVLAFSSQNLKGFSNGYINFSISFRPLSALNGKRVGFGRIQQGAKIVSSLQDYGTKAGRPIKEIMLTHCGIL